MDENHLISEAILKQIESGNRNAFRSFYDITYPLVYRFTHYFLPNKDDCMEVVSEVFYIVWKHRESLMSIKDMRAWLYIVSRNEAFHFLKQKEKYFSTSIHNMPIELSIDSSSIDGRLIEEEMLNVYKEAVNELPERCKLIFLMVREQQLRHKEIADILSISEGTVEQQMNIAIRKIVAIVKKHYPFLRYRK